MDKDPSVILAEIAQTRDRVGNEVDALSYKTDVGARVGDYVDEKTEAVKSKLTGAVDSVTSVTPDQRTITRGATHVRDTAESNPLGLVLGGLAVGFLVGTLLPSTRFENEQLGETSDRWIDATKETASDALDRGKQVAQQAVDGAVDTAKNEGREQSQELTSALPERAQDPSPTPRRIIAGCGVGPGVAPSTTSSPRIAVSLLAGFPSAREKQCHHARATRASACARASPIGTASRMTSLLTEWLTFDN